MSQIKLHEATESIRLRNIYNRISRSKYLINPVITGRYNDDIILLDGANRYGSLKEIGCKLILAQVLDYKSPELQLDKWNHLVYNLNISKIIKFCEENGFKFQRTSYSNGIRKIKKEFHFTLVCDIEKDENIIIQLSDDLDEMVDQLHDLTCFYFKDYDFDRSEGDIRFSDIKKYTRRKGVLIVFPDFRKEHILKIADSKFHLPAGISRHRIINRVLHVKYEIKKLLSDKNISQKQKELKQLLNDKIDKNKVRQYQESVIVFDE